MRDLTRCSTLGRSLQLQCWRAASPHSAESRISLTSTTSRRALLGMSALSVLVGSKGSSSELSSLHICHQPVPLCCVAALPMRWSHADTHGNAYAFSEAQ